MSYNASRTVYVLRLCSIAEVFMDPLTHIVLTRKLVSKDIRIVILGLAPDFPFYLTYPGWLLVRHKARYAFLTGEWPDPPQWMERTHHVFHSLPILFSLAMLMRVLAGRWPRQALFAWALHILVDIPTHSRQRWGPKFLWPFSNYSFDGVSWVECLLRWIR